MKISQRLSNCLTSRNSAMCVDYSASAERLLTGGRDGILRVWRPHRTTCEKTLRGHAKPITHIRVNRKERIFVSLSDDKNVRVWSENAWVCLQSLHVHHMGKCPVSSMCYNVYNNELVLANTGIAKCLGRGTEVFESAITSHDKPLCGVLYHDVFKQILSAGENGVVTVWDILTGKAVIEFKVTPNEHVMVTAMAFDYPQRRLITASYDRKLRVWNFNSGAELGVFPVTMQNEVTGIVCINNSVFVCERNSNIIYDLDINGHDNKYLEYDYLNDIFSMDGHSTTLVASSVNGNIAVWNVETSKVIFWLNTSVSPQVHMVEISLLVICLKTREVNVNTATLLTSANGYIYAWSVISEGGLLGKFREMESEGTFITTMSTDAKEQILLTGDNTGMIFLWDIQGFGYKTEDDKGPFEDINGSWQCHLSGVVSVLCDPPCKNVITGGLDCNLQLWTNTGISIGLFGKDEWDDKIRNSQTQPSESLESLSPNSQIQNFDDLSAKHEEAVSPPEGDAKSELDSKPETEEEPELDSKLETGEEPELDSKTEN
uniref:WD repeat-containing protein on Y chromosome n=1 Tax=Mola mola TaxID=94237 RepID=A0A3Q3W698_MOLML